jgi:hypothetical protein
MDSCTTGVVVTTEGMVEVQGGEGAWEEVEEEEEEEEEEEGGQSATVLMEVSVDTRGKGYRFDFRGSFGVLKFAVSTSSVFMRTCGHTKIIVEMELAIVPL